MEKGEKADSRTSKTVQSRSIEELQAYHEHLLKRVAELEEELKKCNICSYKLIEGNDELINEQTGLPKFKIFLMLCERLKNIKFKYFCGWEVQNLAHEDQILITLMKLKSNQFQEIAYRFGCSYSTIRNVYLTWVRVMHEVLLPSLLSPTALTNSRIVLQFMEIPCVTCPVSGSGSKGSLKGLIGIAFSGEIIFASKLYSGKLSEKYIVENSGILDVLKPGDVVLADKGFLFRDILPEGVNVNVLPSTEYISQQIGQNEIVGKNENHVERSFSLLKSFKILDMIRQESYATILFQLCAGLSNLKNPNLKNPEELLARTSSP